jgi:hypothetical protein
VAPERGQRDGEDAVTVREGVLAEMEHDADYESIAEPVAQPAEMM